MQSLLLWRFVRQQHTIRHRVRLLWDAMIEMYEQFGYYKDAIQSVTMKGIEGLQKIQEIMNSLRQNPTANLQDTK